MCETQNYIEAVHEVCEGRKPACIVELRKTDETHFRALLMIARAHAGWVSPGETLEVYCTPLKDSRGVAHEAFMFGDGYALTGIINAMTDYADGRLSRGEYQYRVGRELGYSEAQCDEFLASPLSRTCGCEMCGGPTPESRADDEAHVRRTMYVSG